MSCQTTDTAVSEVFCLHPSLCHRFHPVAHSRADPVPCSDCRCLTSAAPKLTRFFVLRFLLEFGTRRALAGVASGVSCSLSPCGASMKWQKSWRTRRPAARIFGLFQRFFTSPSECTRACHLALRAGSQGLGTIRMILPYPCLDSLRHASFCLWEAGSDASCSKALLGGLSPELCGLT